jgi:hypothetical protein
VEDVDGIWSIVQTFVAVSYRPPTVLPFANVTVSVTSVPTMPVGNERVVVAKTLAGAFKDWSCEGAGATLELPLEHDVKESAALIVTSATSRIFGSIVYRLGHSARARRALGANIDLVAAERCTRGRDAPTRYSR